MRSTLTSLTELCDVIYAGGDAPEKRHLSKVKTEEFCTPVFSNGIENAGLYGFTSLEPRTNQPAITVSARGTIGHIELRLEPFLPIVRLIVLVPKTEKINITFLKYSLQNTKVFSSGSSIPQLTVPMIKNLKIIVPPLAEQQRFVAKLDAAFAKIDEIIGQTEKKIHQSKLLMQKLIDENIKSESSDMLQVKLDEFCDIKHGFAFDGKSFSVSDDESKPIVLTPGNFAENGTIKFNDKNTKRLQIEYDKKLLFSLDDLVVVMTDLSSKMAFLGKPAFIKQSNILHNQRIGLVKNKEQIIVNDYLYFYFRTSNYLNEIKKTASGTMVRHTSPKRILNNTITAPKSLSKQRAISTKITMSLSKSENLLDIYKTKVSNLLSLKSAIFAKELESEAA